jgi:hypothetical protein
MTNIGEPGSRICSLGPKSDSIPGTKESEGPSITGVQQDLDPVFTGTGSRIYASFTGTGTDLFFVHRNWNWDFQA